MLKVISEHLKAFPHIFRQFLAKKWAFLMKNEAKMGIYFAKKPMFLAKKSRYVQNRFQTFFWNDFWFYTIPKYYIFKISTGKYVRKMHFPKILTFVTCLRRKNHVLGAKKPKNSKKKKIDFSKKINCPKCKEEVPEWSPGHYKRSEETFGHRRLL